MGNGNTDFEKTLKQVEEYANMLELRLPHVADSIYSSVKLIRIYDKNFEKLLKICIEERKALNYACKFLTKREMRKLARYLKKQRKCDK